MTSSATATSNGLNSGVFFSIRINARLSSADMGRSFTTMFFLLQCQLDNLPDEFRVLHAGGSRLAGGAGFRGDIRVRVYFDDIEYSGFIHTHVHPGVTPAHHQLESLQRRGGNVFTLFSADFRRTDYLRPLEVSAFRFPLCQIGRASCRE